MDPLELQCLELNSAKLLIPYMAKPFFSSELEVSLEHGLALAFFLVDAD